MSAAGAFRSGLATVGAMTLALALGTGGSAQQARAPQGAPPPTAQPPAGPPPNPNAAATAADHQNMMEQLGITKLRPGPSGNEPAPNHANYDEALANPYPNLPEVADAEERQEGHERGDVVEAAPPGDRRGLRSRGARPRSAERAEGGVARQPHRDVRRRRTSGRRQGTGRRGRQLGVSRRSPSTSR